MSTELSPELAAEIAAAEEADLNDDAPVYGKLTAREKRDLQKSQLRPLANRRPELYEEDEFTSDEYERMLELYNGTLASIEEGEIVKAHVLEIRENLVVLDIGFKSEGTIPLEEFKDMPDLKAGDEVEVLLEHLEDQEGSVVLSKKKADFMRVWERIRVAYESDQPVEGTLVKKIKGGVVVDLMGVDAFLPGSQIALRRVPNIDELLGQKYEFKIIKLNKRRRNIVVSRRVILETERAGKREKLMKELAKDQVRKGVVKNITDFGAFIDLGGVDGLLHITDMSWGRISHPSEMVQIGMELEIKVLDIDWERERISLGLKQLQSYPWKDVAAKYPVGTRVNGKVVSITNYGAFIELEPGIEGLVHISEMSWTRNVRHPSKIVSIGEAIEAVVLKVDETEEKISLGMKQTEQDPWVILPLKYPVGTRINGKVRNLTSFGAFVEIEPGIDGLIHISDMSWTKRVQHPSEVVKKGDAVDVVILNIDSENKRISLGLKQAEEDPWLRIGETYPVGTELPGKVVRLMDKGVVVDLGNDIEGFVPVSQLNPEGTVTNPADFAWETMNLVMRVLEVDPIHRRIVLAVTSVPEEQPPKPAEPSKVHSSEDELGL
ncbi:30S ribosomal protein S1 [Gemmatimonas sp.]|jgi:small subunit ribosomal protein S1|uniref:30S ribosomal protein S1 n=1 Tax=Gemmatimonas sp. TaxID=1962908 RepID=UPI0022BB1D31|nr:30S ribosomal protein S1 [Gemmatimonas sp.]MCE2954141.1 30S ribosomal protein S1 [Gemmatimonas sp.]MCZ8013162.1 30S ribosomal protein S1 [Gemmatimonas sp.]MCZ8205604.1 30S ribosomal protein S1 [Gemmatimonas sp.]MCZ8265436.1 30S ribosomal protein S1 [Gemmatimonas sp.]